MSLYSSASASASPNTADLPITLYDPISNLSDVARQSLYPLTSLPPSSSPTTSLPVTSNYDLTAYSKWYDSHNLSWGRSIQCNSQQMSHEYKAECWEPSAGGDSDAKKWAYHFGGGDKWVKMRDGTLAGRLDFGHMACLLNTEY